MYKIYADDILIYSPYIDSLKLTSATISLEQNGEGTFKFTMYPTNPYINSIEKMKTIVTVYQDDYLIFRGIAVNDTIGFRNQRTIQCKEEYYFLEFSIQRPYEFSGTPADYFEYLIEEHNSQVSEQYQFILGEVSVEDANDYIARSDTQYLTTWESIQEKLIDTLGGYLRIRHEDDGNYIDYLDDFDTLNSQSVNFGNNLLDITTENDALELGTVLVPLGARLSDIEEEEEEEEEEDEDDDTSVEDEDVVTSTGDEDDDDDDDTEGLRLTIESVNDGLDYLENEDAIEEYGRIVRTKTWDDVTLAENLMSKAQAYLNEIAYHDSTITINAIDMALVDTDITNFRMYNYIEVISDFHGIQDYYLPLSMTIDLFNPKNNQITVGATQQTLTEKTIQTLDQYNDVYTKVERIENNINSTIITTLTEQISSLIEQNADAIYAAIESSLITKSDVQTVVEEKVASMTLTIDDIVFMFEEFYSDSDTTYTSFSDFIAWFNFSAGGLEISNSESDIRLIITNDRLSFYNGSEEVAYISDDKLYITKIIATDYIHFGEEYGTGFRWELRSSGNFGINYITDKED